MTRVSAMETTISHRARQMALATAAVVASACSTLPASDPGAAAVVDAAPATSTPTSAAPTAGSTPVTPGTVVEAYGVKLTGVHLAGSGYLIDVRYRVLDPVKAQPLLDRKLRPVLIDEATGNRFYVPAPPIVGALRQTARNKVIHTDKTYFMLFANPDRRLQPGANVTLYVGDQKFANLRVEAL